MILIRFTLIFVLLLGSAKSLAQAPGGDPLDALVGILRTTTDAQVQLDILNGMSAAMKGRRSVPMPEGWNEIETKLANSGDAEIRSLAQSLSLTFGSQSALASLRRTVQDASVDAAIRRRALESLLAARDPGLPKLLQQLLADTALRGQAVRALAAYDDAETPAALLKVYSSLNASEKRDALNALAARAAFAQPLLAAVESGQVASKELTPDLVRQLRNLKNPQIDAAIQRVWGAFRDSSADKQAEIEKYKQIYRAGGSQPGDATRGRAVYARVCQQCHTLFDSGGKVGPDLTGSNRSDLDYILQNMVDPNAVIPNDYRTSTLETKDGRVITGIVKQQDANGVTIATQTETVTIPRAEILELQQSELSMMPEGLLTSLTDQEVRDLIYYLTRPGQVPLLGTPETLGLFFNGKDLSGWDGEPSLWKVENGEIVGRSAAGLKHNEFLKSQMLLSDFRLICKVKLVPNKENSGIQFRSDPLPDGEVKGYQADIGAGWWGKLYEEQGRALLWDKSGEAQVRVEDWNTYEIVAIGSKIKTAINGKLCVDLDDPSGAKQGIIALQLHSGGPMEVRFKDFQLEVNPKPGLVTAQ
jgi:putative heme-binding domain-containing protein